MKVAYLADVHANLPAFESALDSAKRWGADETFLLGDLVTDGPHPREVVDLARKRRLAGVSSASDLVATGAAPVPAAWRGTSDEARLAWTRARLDRASLAYLSDMPRSRRMRSGRLHVACAHEASTLAGAEWDVLVSGATHRASVRWLPGEKWMLDAGSVGRPLDGPEATLLLADFEEARFDVARVAFDVASWRRDLARFEAETLIVPDRAFHNPQGA